MKLFNDCRHLLLIFTLLSCSSFDKERLPAQQEAFDEIYGLTGGKPENEKIIRSPYEGVVKVYKKLSAQRKQKIKKRTLRDFSGDNSLSPIPRVLSEDEYKELSEGVEQRARALQAFLDDHYGNKNYLKDGIIPKSVIDKITRRSHEDIWEKYIKPGMLNFWYGPDVIRGPPEDGFPEGRFFVVEDNLSFIGGVGDLIAARQILDKHVPGYTKVIDSPDPIEFYSRIIKSYKERASEFGGKAIMVQYPRAYAADNEDIRVTNIFEERGIETVFIDPEERNTKFRKGKRLVVNKNGVYLEKKSSKGEITSEKVGYIINVMDPQDLELSHPANWKHFLLLVAEDVLFYDELSKLKRKQLKDLLKPNGGQDINFSKLYKFFKDNARFDLELLENIGLPGIFDAMLAGKIGMTNTPGADFVGDKSFYIYIEQLISYYLKEVPILKNMKTGSFANFDEKQLARLDKDTLAKVFKNLDQYVVKGVDGRGGDAVWVGPKVDKKEIPALIKKIKENPSGFIYQAYTPLSTIDGNIGDIRLISEIWEGKVEVADVPWARVVSKEGDGKVNIGSEGFEATVLVDKKKPPECILQFLKLTQ